VVERAGQTSNDGCLRTRADLKRLIGDAWCTWGRSVQQKIAGAPAIPRTYRRALCVQRDGERSVRTQDTCCVCAGVCACVYTCVCACVCACVHCCECKTCGKRTLP